MIYLDILASLEKALGTALEPEQRKRAVEVMATNMGGSMHYFQKLPKLRHRAVIEMIYGTMSGASSSEIARKTGLHVRTVQRLRKA